MFTKLYIATYCIKTMNIDLVSDEFIIQDQCNIEKNEYSICLCLFIVKSCLLSYIIIILFIY